MPPTTFLDAVFVIIQCLAFWADNILGHSILYPHPPPPPIEVKGNPRGGGGFREDQKILGGGGGHHRQQVKREESERAYGNKWYLTEKRQDCLHVVFFETGNDRAPDN